MAASNQKSILIVPGSLRKDSSSYKLISAVVKHLPEDFSYTVYSEIGLLPHFDDAEAPSEKVNEWRRLLGTSGGVLIITPEYAHGVPGSLKNALDWTVASAEIDGKPLALITASTRGQYGHQALLQILKALNANVPQDSALLLSFIRSKVDTNGNILDEATDVSLLKLVRSLIATVLETDQ
jgi:NAD(P)H-dependent FMN reductase